MDPQVWLAPLLVLYAALLFVAAGFYNAFSQSGLTWQRKAVYFLFGVGAAVVAALANDLGYPPADTPHTRTVFAIGYGFVFVSLLVLTKAWRVEDTTSENTIRDKLLQAVDDEASDRLKDNLPADITIQTEGRPDYVPEVEIPISRRVRSWIANLPVAVVPSSKPTLDIFEQDGINGKLLILGEPGSGKTTELLKLAKELSHRTLCELNNKTHPVPVIFEMSSWQPGKTIEDWLADELKLKYSIDPELSKKWLRHGKLLPLLDGLDELKERMEAGVDAIAEFL